MIMWETIWTFFLNIKMLKKKWIDCTYGNIHLGWVGIFCTNWLKNNNKKAYPPNVKKALKKSVIEIFNKPQV